MPEPEDKITRATVTANRLAQTSLTLASIEPTDEKLLVEQQFQSMCNDLGLRYIPPNPPAKFELTPTVQKIDNKQLPVYVLKTGEKMINGMVVSKRGSGPLAHGTILAKLILERMQREREEGIKPIPGFNSRKDVWHVKSFDTETSIVTRDEIKNLSIEFESTEVAKSPKVTAFIISDEMPSLDDVSKDTFNFEYGMRAFSIVYIQRLLREKYQNVELRFIRYSNYAVDISPVNYFLEPKANRTNFNTSPAKAYSAICNIINNLKEQKKDLGNVRVFHLSSDLDIPDLSSLEEKMSKLISSYPNIAINYLAIGDTESRNYYTVAGKILEMTTTNRRRNPILSRIVDYMDLTRISDLAQLQDLFLI